MEKQYYIGDVLLPENADINGVDGNKFITVLYKLENGFYQDVVTKIVCREVSQLPKETKEPIVKVYMNIDELSDPNNVFFTQPNQRKIN